MRLTLALVLAGLALPALAADDCATSEDQTTLTQCAQEELGTADEALNAAWKQVTAQLADSPDIRKLLTKSQKHWIAFRDAECDFRAATTIGGTIHPMLVAQCLTHLTEARTVQLSDYLRCEEGDMTCPVPPAN